MDKSLREKVIYLQRGKVHKYRTTTTLEFDPTRLTLEMQYTIHISNIDILIN